MSEKKSLKLTKKQWLQLVIAFLLGAFWIFAIRFVTAEKKETHYHANFAVFVEGNRMPFDNFTYYEEVQACFDGPEARPQSRVHMHDMVNHVVHVHDYASTWGHFFANLGMTAGDILFRYDDVIYIDDEQTTIKYLLNGEEVTTIANRIIGDADALLISINLGDPEDGQLQREYDEIQKDAAEYNKRQDPSSCSGGKPFTFWERVKASLGFFNE